MKEKNSTTNILWKFEKSSFSNTIIPVIYVTSVTELYKYGQ